MTSVASVELAVGADECLAVLAVDPLLVVVVLAEVLRRLLLDTAQQGKVLGKGRHVLVVDRVHSHAGGTLELTGSVARARVIARCHPLAPGVADVEDNLLVVVFLRLHAEEPDEALCVCL